jgi:hypothetical protein
MRVLVSSGAAATGVVLGILMALAIGAVEGSTADLDSTATDTPSDLPTAVDGGIDSTELAPGQRLTICCFDRPGRRRGGLAGEKNHQSCQFASVT